MKVLCNLTTKKIIGFSRWDEIPHDPEFYIVLDVTEVPSVENERLNDTNDGLRPATQAEIDADIETEKDSQITRNLNNGASTQKAIALTLFDEINVLRVNAGLPEITVTQLKAAVKTKL